MHLPQDQSHGICENTYSSVFSPNSSIGAEMNISEFSMK